MSNDTDTLKQKARDLHQRFNFTTDKMDEREGPPTPPPPAHHEEKKAFSIFREAVTEVLAKSVDKTAAELTEAARSDLPKKDFAVPASKSNTGEKAYPIPDEQHARSALGFAKMHHDSADYAAVRAKVEKKYPNLLKKQAMVTAAAAVFMSKEAGPLMQRMGTALASERGSHIADLASLAALAVPGADQLQAHARAGLSGKYSKEEVKKREFLPHVAHPLAETVGLGGLAATTAAKMRYGAH